MALIERRFLFEDENDGGVDASTTDDSTSDTSTDGTTDDTSSSEDQSDDTSNEDSSEEDQNTDDTGDEEKDNADNEDYSIDSEPDEDENSSDDNSESEDDSDNSDDIGDENTDTEEKALDRELFDSLTDSEKKRKIVTLKKLYMDLYSKCDTLVDKFNQLSTNDENFDPVIKRILIVLYDLKEYVSYYVLNVYDKVSYIENDVTFNRYLSILNGVKLIIEELEKEHKKEIESK